MTEQRANKKQVPRESILSDCEHRLRALKRELIAAALVPSTELSMEEVRKKGVLTVLRKLTDKNSIKSFEC
jgi:hypothetical protein